MKRAPKLKDLKPSTFDNVQYKAADVIAAFDHGKIDPGALIYVAMGDQYVPLRSVELGEHGGRPIVILSDNTAPGKVERTN